MSQIVNFSTRKVGGIRFVKIGRLTLSFSLSRAYKPMKAKPYWPCLKREMNEMLADAYRREHCDV